MKFYTLILTTALTFPLFALEKTKTDPFKQALMEAYQTNPDLAAAQADYRSTMENEGIAMGTFLPTLSAQGTYSNNNSSFSYTAADNPTPQQQFAASSYTSNYNNLNLGLTAKYNIFSGLRDLANLSATQYNVMAAASALNNTESTTLTNAITAYMDYLTKQEVLRFNLANEQSLKAVYEAEKTKFQVGENTKAKLLQAQAGYEGSKAQRISAQGDVEVSRATYQKVIGSLPGHITLPSLPKEKLPKSLSEAIDLTLERNSAIIQAKFTEKAMNEGWTVKAGAFLPTIDLQAQWGYNWYSGANVPSNFPHVGTNSATNPAQNQIYSIQANWNLFNGLKDVGAFNQSIEAIQKAKFQVESARRTGIQTVTQGWQQLIRARDTIAAQRASIAANTEALQALRQGERLGTQTLLDVLNQESLLLQAQQGLATAIQQEALATFAILNAIGALSAHELGLVEIAQKE